MKSRKFIKWNLKPIYLKKEIKLSIQIENLAQISSLKISMLCTLRE